MPESIYDRKARIRPPRVHISYEVEIGGAMVMKELPFVQGVISDLAGDVDPATRKAPLKDRKFEAIDRDNFDNVLASMRPRLALRVPNTLQKGDGGEPTSDLKLVLDFNQLQDFEPEQVARQVAPLATLLDVRSKLKDLLSRMEGNERLESLLNALLEDPELRAKLQSALPAAAAPSAEEK